MDGSAGSLTSRDVEGRPSAVLAWGEDGVLVTSDGEADSAGRLRTYDAEDGGAGTAVTVGAEPVALVGVGDAVWTIGATGVLTKVDPAAGTVLAEVDLGGATTDAVVADGKLFVADIGRSLVHVLDPESGEVVADAIVVEAGAVRLVTDGAGCG